MISDMFRPALVVFPEVSAGFEQYMSVFCLFRQVHTSLFWLVSVDFRNFWVVFASVWILFASVWAVPRDFFAYFSTVSWFIACWCGYLTYFSTVSGVFSPLL